MIDKQLIQTFRGEVFSKISPSILPGSVVNPFYEFYNSYVNPGKYRDQPCTCNPTQWRQMIEETRVWLDAQEETLGLLNELHLEEDSDLPPIEEIVEEPAPKRSNRKKQL